MNIQILEISGNAEDLKYLEILLKEKINIKSLEVNRKEQKILQDNNVLSCISISYDRDEIDKRFCRSYENVGRKKKDIDDTLKDIRKKMKTKTADEVAQEYGISRRTLFRRLKEYEADEE